MTDIEWAIVHYDGNNDEPYADLVVDALRQKRDVDALASEYGIDAKTMLTLAKSQIETAKENRRLREALDNKCDSCACELLDRAEKLEANLSKAIEFADYKTKLCDSLTEQLARHNM